MAPPQDSLDHLSDDELDALIRAALAELTNRGTTEAFGMLAGRPERTGGGPAWAKPHGWSPRRGSWSQVAQISGTTKQAAWSRWR